MTEPHNPASDVAAVVDTETTGIGEPIEVVELGWLMIEPAPSLAITREHEERFCPSKPIECGALATHHIMDEEWQQCRPSRFAVIPFDANYMIGHAVDYDWKAIGSPDVRRIDTCCLARALWPECDSFGLGALLYYLDRQNAGAFLEDAHGALADCKATLHLLTFIVARFEAPAPTWERLWRASEKARIPTRFPFGKHRGLPIAEAPRDYREWMLHQEDMDPYLIEAVRRSM